MFVEGTLRWQVTEDCPWDVLVALALRDLGGLVGAGAPVLPPVVPAVAAIPAASQGLASEPAPARTASRGAGSALLKEQWEACFALAADRERRPRGTLFHAPHFESFDRAIELQDLVIANYDAAVGWASERQAEYARTSLADHARRAADIVDVVHEREHDLRRQAGYFRLDIDVLPLAESGAWIVGPRTVVVSSSMRDDSQAFRAWFRPLVAALV